MLNPRYQHYADRLRELIQEGQRVAKMERPSTVGPYIQDHIPLHAWLAKVDYILVSVFGVEGAHFRHFKDIVQGDIRLVSHAHQVNQTVGILTGALDDLEKGYLTGQEFLIAGEIFDSVLEQARYLNQNGYKDPAAVLGRVVLEDALKRLAREQGIDDTQKASRINDELKRTGRYPQPQWRLIQAWLDIGNAAAHGSFGDYNRESVERSIQDLGRFLAAEFRGKWSAR